MPSLLRRLNYLPAWHGFHHVWGNDIFHPSLDRWLYLFLHRVGIMGRLEYSVIKKIIRPGMNILDIGGNVGLYTALFSNYVGPQGTVTVFEPVSELYQAIQQTVGKSRLMNVETFPYAAGAANGTVTLALDSLNSGNNWISRNSTESSLGAIPVRRLDTLDIKRPIDFIKIDVQGWEVEVLRGMAGLFQSGLRPIIFCEVSESALAFAGTSSLELGRVLEGYGYDLKFPVLKGRKLNFIPLAAAALQQKASATFYFDILAVPRGAVDNQIE